MREDGLCTALFAALIGLIPTAAVAQEPGMAGELSAARLDVSVARVAPAFSMGPAPVYLIVPESSPDIVIGVPETVSLEAALTRPGDRVRIVLQGVGPGGDLKGLPMASEFDNLSIPIETRFTPPDLPRKQGQATFEPENGVVKLEPAAPQIPGAGRDEAWPAEKDQSESAVDSSGVPDSDR